MLMPLYPRNLFFKVLTYQPIKLYFQASNLNNIDFATIANFDALVKIPADIFEIICASLAKDVATLSTVVLPLQQPELSGAPMTLWCQIAWGPFCHLNIIIAFTAIVFLAKRILNFANLATCSVS